MGSLENRLSRLESLVEERVEVRVREELEAALDNLEQHLTRHELVRVLRILTGEEEEPEGWREKMATTLRRGEEKAALKEAQGDSRRRHALDNLYKFMKREPDGA